MPASRSQLVRGEKHAGHAPLDELAAELLGLLEAQVGIEPRLVGAAPDQPVIMHPRQARKLAADQLEDLGVAQARHQQRQQFGGRAGFRTLPDKRSGSRAALDQALVRQHPQGTRDRGAGNPEAAHQLGLARHPAFEAVAACQYLVAKLAGNLRKAQHGI